MNSFELTDQQKMVISAIAEGKNVRVDALAGCGKTTTILTACGVATGKKAFVAFNKSIATEIQSKCPTDVKASTIHSMGFSIIRNNLGTVQIEDHKNYDILMKMSIKKTLFSPILKLVGLVKNNLCIPTDSHLEYLAENYQVEYESVDQQIIFDTVREIIEMNIPKPNQPIVITFDDMIWLPVVMNLSNCPQYDFLGIEDRKSVV